MIGSTANVYNNAALLTPQAILSGFTPPPPPLRKLNYEWVHVVPSVSTRSTVREYL